MLEAAENGCADDLLEMLNESVDIEYRIKVRYTRYMCCIVLRFGVLWEVYA